MKSNGLYFDCVDDYLIEVRTSETHRGRHLLELHNIPVHVYL